MSLQDVQRLINIQRSRLQRLKEQRATYGINTPPEIAIEIENIEAYIAALHEELNQLAPSYQLTIIQPESRTIYVPISKKMGNGHHCQEKFSGTVYPEYPENGIWLIRLRKLSEHRNRSHRPNEYSVYRATKRENDIWGANIRFHLWGNQMRSEYEVWAVIPGQDTLMLFEFFEANYQETGRLEKEVLAKDYKLSVNWLQLPADRFPSFLKSTENNKVEVILTRSETE